jgi:hypothetical protein
MTGFGIRLFVVSGVNYFFGNVMFAILWKFFGNYLEYWKIAILCTCVASVFSFQTQSRFILKQRTVRFVNFRFISFQLLGLALAIIFVPRLARDLKIDIVTTQFVWSAFYSLLSLLLLRQKRFE